MNTLVTGATTPLGLALIDRLVDARGTSRVLAVGLEPEPPAELARRGVEYRALDLSRPRAIHDLLYGPARDLEIEAVIHGPLHRSARAQGRAVHATNVESTRELLLACEDHPTIRRFVYRSVGGVYAIRASEPNLLDEDAPLELARSAPQLTRDRVEADVTVATKIGTSRLAIAVLRCAEVLAPGTGSQLWDYLQTRVCLRPAGFDPMLDVLSLADQARALVLAARSSALGVFNIPGADRLPLSKLVERAGCLAIPVPGPLLAPLYQLRTWTVGLEFRYDLNLRRFHFGGILDGTRARTVLGYLPRHSVWEDGALATPGRRPAEPRDR